MKKHLTQILNWTGLAIVLVGLPAVASARFGSLRLTADETAWLLMMGGAGMMAALNAVAGWKLARGAVAKSCRRWTAVHIAFGVFLWLVSEDQVEFGWLKDALLWLRDQIS